MRRWIMDEDDTPQRFPLQRLLRRVFEVTGARDHGCDVTRVRGGYGERVHALEESLDSIDAVRVSFSEIEALTEGREEWFYDFEAKLPGTAIRFGLHDSTALFVEGEQPFVEAVVAAFDDSRPAL